MDSTEDQEDDGADEQIVEYIEYLSGAAHMVDINADFKLDNEVPTSFVATGDDADNVTAYAATARDGTVSRALTGAVYNDARYDDSFYYGLMVDTVCVCASSSSLSQYRTYCRHVGERENIDQPERFSANLGLVGNSP